MPHDAVEMTVASSPAADRVTDSDSVGPQHGAERQFAYAQFVHSLDNALAARLVRLEGEVFALRHELALLSRAATDSAERPSPA